MNSVWDRVDLPDYAVNHGVMSQGDWTAGYYTSQPDPGHWIAVGLVAPVDVGSPRRRRMLVGQGSTEDEAINVLRARIAGLAEGGQSVGAREPLAGREDSERI